MGMIAALSNLAPWVLCMFALRALPRLWRRARQALGFR